MYLLPVQFFVCWWPSCRLSNRQISFICIQNAAAAAAAALCCYTAVVAAAAVLLLPAAVCHRVPMAKFVAGSFWSQVFSFFSFKHDLLLMYPLAVLPNLRPHFAYILSNYGHAQNQGGRQPAAAKTPLYTKYTCTYAGHGIGHNFFNHTHINSDVWVSYSMTQLCHHYICHPTICSMSFNCDHS